MVLKKRRLSACQQLLLCGFAFGLCSGLRVFMTDSRCPLSPPIFFRFNFQNPLSCAVTGLHSDVDTAYLNKRIMNEANRIRSQRTGFIVLWIRRILPMFRSNMLSPSSGWNRAHFCRGGICLNYTIL
jgi:hypothetical protein